MTLSLNTKHANFFVHHTPQFIGANTLIRQSSSPEDASRIYAEIARLKQLKETVGWNDANWVEASQLYEQRRQLQEIRQTLQLIEDGRTAIDVQ